MRFNYFRLLSALFAVLSSTAFAGTNWYVNGVSGSDSNNCLSASTACKTIGHAISRAASGDSIRVAAATYTENLTIGISLTIIGAAARTTIIDGGAHGTVLTVSNAKAHVGLWSLTIRNGAPYGGNGGGISNDGTLTVSNSIITGNGTRGTPGLGGGIRNVGTLTVNNCTISNNTVSGSFGAGFGGGIGNGGTAVVNNSTITGNTSSAWGGGVGNEQGNLTISNSTISGNKEIYSHGGLANYSGVITLQNTIVANNSGGDCYERTAITSNGYNLSSDQTCDFNGPGDRNDVNPMLGPLANNGGPTPTLALIEGSPAIDAGNPGGCRDSKGNLLKADQRGMPRPDKEDTGGCDIGAYEKQSD